MWTCPSCGAGFVGRSMSHSCVRRSADEFLADKPPTGVRLFRAFVREVERAGPVRLHAVKTRIALMVHVRFAAVYKLGDGFIRGHLWLREERASARFRKIEKLGSRDWLYHFEVSSARPIDAELRRFIRLAYQNGRRPPGRAVPRRVRPPADSTGAEGRRRFYLAVIPA